MIKIIAVKYLNTLPFVYGIEESGFLEDFILDLDIPSMCAQKLENGDADIGLVPIAALNKLKDYSVFSDFCIGAEKSVGSVLLVAQKPIDELKEIYLDYQSRTTNFLIQIIYNKYLDISPLWINSTSGFERSIRGSTGGVIIGDRALELADQFQYKYDIAALWNKYTNLPFVFACWVAKSSVPKETLTQFNQAISWGVAHKHDVVHNSDIDIDVRHYLDNCISYELDHIKREAMELYLDELRALHLAE
jgi:chorismate dehydratase